MYRVGFKYPIRKERMNLYWIKINAVLHETHELQKLQKLYMKNYSKYYIT